ncbi:hypothetical protein [Paenibacillus sp. 1P03SA]|uniref:hypothetical protein n=1 Tax=Paenibacillus sp. 1P03SA TaxID=3132294 RepID=UPI0039A10F46
MSVRYPLNFVLFVCVILMVTRFVPSGFVLQIAIIAIVMTALDYIMDKIGLSKKRVPVYAGGGVIALVAVFLLLADSF